MPIKQVHVLDITGKCLKEIDCSGVEKMEANLEDLHEGIYMIQVIAGENGNSNYSSTSRLMIKN